MAYILQRTKSLSIEYLVADDWDSPSNIISVMLLGNRFSKLTVEAPEKDWLRATALCVGQDFNIIDTGKQADTYGAVPSVDPLNWFDTQIEKDAGGGFTEMERYGRYTFTIDNHMLRKPVVRSTNKDLAKTSSSSPRNVLPSRKPTNPIYNEDATTPMMVNFKKTTLAKIVKATATANTKRISGFLRTPIRS